MNALCHQHKAKLGLLAVALLSLQAFLTATVLVDVSGFERYCRVVDGSPAAASLEAVIVLGPATALLLGDFRAIGEQSDLPTWRICGNRLLALIGLGYVALYMATLRLPWIVGQAGETDRVTLWSAQLSSTVGGVPVLAFAHALGYGVFLHAVAAAALRALRTAGYMGNPKGTKRFYVAIGSPCALAYVVGLASFVDFATGGSL